MGQGGWLSLVAYKIQHTQNYLCVCMCVCVCVCAQSRLTLCDLMDYSTSVSSVHGILQESTLEGVAIPFSRGSS